MSKKTIHAESVLAVDFGTIQTRVNLFDVVEDSYHFIAGGNAPSTVGAPFYDVSESLRQAVYSLQQITGRILWDEDAVRLRMPSANDGSGVDRLVVCMSAGRKLNIFPYGILSDVSLKSARHLAASTYHRVVELVGLGDNRPLDERLDDILKARPDVVILAGGTEQGASRSVLKNASMVALICRLLPQECRPYIIYAGNQSVAARIKELLQPLTPVFVASNIRPSIDVEDLAPAKETLAEVFGQFHSQQIGGLKELQDMSGVPLLPTAYAFSRMLRYLSHVNHTGKRVLGVDVGAGSTSLVLAQKDDIYSNVLPVGMGNEEGALLEHCNLADITRWLPFEISAEEVHDMLWNKSLYPASIPATREALLVEHAVARQLLRLAVQKAVDEQPDWDGSSDPVVAGGAVLAAAASPAQSLHILLDGLQPLGVTTFILDARSLLASLGAVAPVNSLLPVQVLESGVFTTLATVISPISQERSGAQVLQVRLEYENGDELSVDVRQGMLEVLPLPSGQSGLLHLQPAKNVMLDTHLKRGRVSLKVTGGVCGLVIDARGRPLNLPGDDRQRWSRLNRWAMALDSYVA